MQAKFVPSGSAEETTRRTKANFKSSRHRATSQHNWCFEIYAACHRAGCRLCIIGDGECFNCNSKLIYNSKLEFASYF